MSAEEPESEAPAEETEPAAPEAEMAYGCPVTASRGQQVIHVALSLIHI